MFSGIGIQSISRTGQDSSKSIIVSGRHTSDFPALNRRTESDRDCPSWPMLKLQRMCPPLESTWKIPANACEEHDFLDASQILCKHCGCPSLLLTVGLTFACICYFLWSLTRSKGEGCGEGRQNNVLPRKTTEDVMQSKERRTKRIEKNIERKSFPWREADLGTQH